MLLCLIRTRNGPEGFKRPIATLPGVMFRLVPALKELPIQAAENDLCLLDET